MHSCGNNMGWPHGTWTGTVNSTICAPAYCGPLHTLHHLPCHHHYSQADFCKPLLPLPCLAAPVAFSWTVFMPVKNWHGFRLKRLGTAPGLSLGQYWPPFLFWFYLLRPHHPAITCKHSTRLTAFALFHPPAKVPAWHRATRRLHAALPVGPCYLRSPTGLNHRQP